MADDKKKPKKPAGEDSGKSKGKGGGGGSLDLTFGRGLRLFLLAAILPLLLVTWCAVGWQGGPVLRGGVADLHGAAAWWRIGEVFLGVLVFISAFWLFWPLGQWLRKASVGYFAGNRILGFIPLVLATPLWIAFYATAVTALAAGAMITWRGLEHLGLVTLVKALGG
ncbi:MAG: hypothetical protein L6R48_01540 [Planctomycetes bacterium]|nr:hypothetical protein [Planctomycetota bacterium]